jgi:hypothetical protein
MKRPTTAVLIARAFTGLVTIWCLGCSGYEPLLNALLGTGAVMTCASEMSEGTEPGAMSAAVASASNTAELTAAESSPRGFDCGCGSCHAPSPRTPVQAGGSSARPFVVGAPIIEPVSVSRAPVAPPPQRRA